jgi:hypothetical protein
LGVHALNAALMHGQKLEADCRFTEFVAQLACAAGRYWQQSKKGTA